MMKLPIGGTDPNGSNVYRKSYEVMEMIRSIIESADEKNDDYGMLYDMFNTASKLSILISRAEFMGIYDIKVETAYVVKHEYKNLKTNLLIIDPAITEKKYLDLLSEEIDSFRKVFLKWVAGFDKSIRMSDEWDISTALSH